MLGVTIVNEVFHPFSPQGVTGVVIIEESHISIHTWPEKNYVAIDVFTCGEKDPENFAPVIFKQFGAKTGHSLKIIRGIPFGFRVLEPKALG